MNQKPGKTWLACPVIVSVIIASLSFAVGGCGKSAQVDAGSEFLLANEPNGAVDVLAIRENPKDQQPVVVVGRIGGRVNPWVKGVAAFPIVDRSLKPCNEIEGDTCETPWDYCCEPNLPKATVLVHVVDEMGKTIKQDPREFLGVKELQTVVVQGKTKLDGAGNVTVYASQLHVRPEVSE